jgi:hypothetical protein
MDPRLEQLSDFANHNLYRLIIQDKVAGGSSQEDAVAYVRTVWERNRDQRAAAWDAQQAQQAQQPPAAPNVQAVAQGKQGHQGIPANPALQAQAVAPPAGDLPGNGVVLPQQPPAVKEIKARDLPKSLPIVIITGQPVSKNLSYQPERKVLEALHERQYVSLYYFLDSTCKAAFERQSFLAADKLTLQLDGDTPGNFRSRRIPYWLHPALFHASSQLIRSVTGIALSTPETSRFRKGPAADGASWNNGPHLRTTTRAPLSVPSPCLRFTGTLRTVPGRPRASSATKSRLTLLRPPSRLRFCRPGFSPTVSATVRTWSYRLSHSVRVNLRV